MAWKKGQRVTIDRRLTTTIERVTPTGRAVANGKTFNPDGVEIVKGWRRSKLDLLTPQIQAEMEDAKRASKISRDIWNASERLQTWVRSTMSTWNGRVPDPDDVVIAERLLAAINSVFPEQPK